MPTSLYLPLRTSLFRAFTNLSFSSLLKDFTFRLTFTFLQLAISGPSVEAVVVVVVVVEVVVIVEVVSVVFLASHDALEVIVCMTHYTE